MTQSIENQTLDRVLGAIRDVGPEFAACAETTENAGRVPQRSLELLRETGAFDIVKPMAYGGLELGPSAILDAGFEIGRYCGSTGWCGTLAIFYHQVLSFFPKQAQDEIFAEKDNLFAVSYLPTKNCEIVDGGFRIWGSWAYSSNCDNAAYMMVAALVPNEDNEPNLAWFIVPASDVTIDHDSWNTVGLRGTGSKIVRIDEPVTVPAHRMIYFKDVAGASVPGQAVAGNLLAFYPFSVVGPTALVSPILGMAQGALDSFTDSAKSRLRTTRPGAAAHVINNPLIQMRIGWASAMIDSARALLKNQLHAAEARIRAGEKLSADERIGIRRAQAFAAKQSVLVVNELFAKEGTAAANASAPIQRFWRDANAAASHITLDWEAVSTMYGQHKLGLEPVGAY